MAASDRRRLAEVRVRAHETPDDGREVPPRRSPATQPAAPGRQRQELKVADGAQGCGGEDLDAQAQGA
ncbi:hypothetical protein, partial [uncultured Arthrobacter sp.]|uniref:hypothetical protein n=1 Tax=uncultured Arthrobacter sp. TaxID=114050 RepID=UPI003217F5E5